MVSFKRALKNAGKKIKKVFIAPFCSTKKKIIEGENKENFKQPVSDSSNIFQTNCSAEIAQDEAQGLIVIETHSACKKISEESLSETPVAQATSTDAIMEEADSGNSVENSDGISDNSPQNKEKTIIDVSVEDTEQVAVGSSKTNDVPPLGVNATDVVGEDEVLLTCISNEKTEQLHNFISTQYSSEKILNGINQNLVLQIISTICCLSLNNKSKRANSTEEIVHFEVNLNKNTFCFYSSKPAEVATEVNQQNDTTEEEDQNKTEDTAASQNEVISNNNSIPNEEQVICNDLVTNPLIHHLIPSPRKVQPIKDNAMVRMNRRSWRNNPRRKTLTNGLNINLKAIKTKI